MVRMWSPQWGLEINVIFVGVDNLFGIVAPRDLFLLRLTNCSSVSVKLIGPYLRALKDQIPFRAKVRLNDAVPFYCYGP